MAPEPDIVLKTTGWDIFDLDPAKSNYLYAVTGEESQVVTIAVGEGDSVKGEPGVMMYLTDGIEQQATCDGCCARACSGEDCFVMNFINNGSTGQAAYVALTPNFPTAKVIPVDLSAPSVDGVLIAQQGAFMASYGDVHIGISLDCNLGRCCCAGTGFVRQKLEGRGTAFIAATGTIIQKVLAPGETILADTNCILAFAGSCKLDIRRAGGILGMLGGGEGIFNTSITGPGLVLVQSMNQDVFLKSLIAQKLISR